MNWKCALLFLAFVGVQGKLKLCVQEDVTESSCNALARLDSPIKCERVVDSAECAIKLADGRADFGIFTADELLLANTFYPNGTSVIAELRNKDKINELFNFQSVVVIPKNHTLVGDGLDLSGSGYCHPGFSKTQLWSDHVMKYFEKKVIRKTCRKDVTTYENEIIDLKNYFKKACRPGNWVPDDALDKKLKKKYPELCELCSDKEKCRYYNTENHGHTNALECLTSGRGKIAYVSLNHVRNYFASEISQKNMFDYQFFCQNGTRMDLDVENPCSWHTQPWKVILAREEVKDEVAKKLDQTAEPSLAAKVPWQKSLKDILYIDETPVIHVVPPSIYLIIYKGTSDLPTSHCGEPIRWCTVNNQELLKCNWTAAAARGLGIQPNIACLSALSTFECFDWIANGEADIMAVDSNYGLLARKTYGLTALLYCETMEDHYSVVVAVTKDGAVQSGKTISSWSDLQGKNACFPEFGGIAWLSFVNAVRAHRVVSDSCAYPRIVSKLLKGACAPGFVEADHAQDRKKQSLQANGLGNLCDLCPNQSNGARCEANDLNEFYGDKGALDCLSRGVGDIAFLEVRNLNAFVENNSINTTEYRILCKNGSLAETTGFDVDRACALSVTIDSEVISRRNQSDPHLIDASLVLLKIEDWLGYRGDSERRAVHIYDPFDGHSDLLFKNSTLGLVPADSTVRAVIAYKELFEHADSCSSSGTALFVVYTIVLINFLIARSI